MKFAKVGAAAFAVGLTAGMMDGGALADGYEPRRGLKDKSVEAPKPDWTLSANVGLATEYVFRGFSQTAGHAAIQGGFDFTYRWFYFGVWASSLDFGGRVNGTGILQDVADIETDVYAGIKHSFGKVDVDFGVIYYSYPDAFDRRLPSSTGFIFTEQRELDYVEIKLGLSTKLHEKVTIGATVFYSPEYTNKTGEVVTLEGSISVELPKVGRVTPTVSALVGHQMGDDLRYRFLIGNGVDNYTYWNAGLTLGFLEKFSLDLRYWDTSIDNNAATKPIGTAGFGSNNFCDGQVTGIFQCDSRFVATLKFSLN